MMKAAVKSIKKNKLKTKILGVTLLTSLDGKDSKKIYKERNTKKLVKKFSEIANNLKAAMTDGSSEVKDDLDDVNTLLEDINQISTSLGYKENQIYLSQNRLDTANMNLSSLLSETEDVDLAEAITVYNSQEIAYRAAMQTAADVLKLNIMDYLR